VYKNGDATNQVLSRKITTTSWPGTDGVGTASTIATDSHTNYNYSQPSIVTDVNNRVWTAYNYKDGSTYGIKVTYSDDGGANWSTGVLLQSVSDERNSPAITMWNGNPVAVYKRAEWYLNWSYYNGTSWSTAEQINTINAGNDFSAVVTGDSPNQKLHVANISSTTPLHISWKVNDGMSWSSGQNIETGAKDICPSLVSDGTHVWMFFNRYVAVDNYDVSYRVNNGTSWSNFTDIFADSENDKYPSPCRYNSPGSIPFMWSSYTSPYKVKFSKLYKAPEVNSVTPGSGANTSITAVTITGNGFFKETWSDTTMIKLVDGSTEYSLTGYSVINNTTINGAVVPSGCTVGTYDVKVSNSVGQSTNAVKFEVQ